MSENLNIKDFFGMTDEEWQALPKYIEERRSTDTVAEAVRECEKLVRHIEIFHHDGSRAIRARFPEYFKEDK